MTIAQILALTGNTMQSMSYEELAQITKVMASAARKRINRLPEGPAYRELYNKAVGYGSHAQTKGLDVNVHKQFKVEIKVKTKGKDKLSIYELRTLRKDLYNYLKDDVSTKKGYEKYKEDQERLRKQREYHQVVSGEKWETEAVTEQDLLDRAETNSDLIYFAKDHLQWASTQIKAAIIEAGGYGNINFNILKDFIIDGLRRTGNTEYMTEEDSEYDAENEVVSEIFSNNKFEDIFK